MVTPAMRVPGGRAALILLLSAAWSPAWSDAASEAMVRAFIARVDAEPGWSATTARVLSEGDETLIEGLVLTREEKPVTIRAERIRLTRLGPREGGGFRAESMDVAGFAFETPTLTMAAPGASATSIAVPDILGIPFEPDRLMVFSAKLNGALAKAEAVNITISSLTSSQTTPLPNGGAPVRNDTSYGPLVFENLANGVIERTSVESIAIDMNGPDGAPVGTIKLASVEVLGSDLAASAHVFDPDAYAGGKGDGAWRTLATSIAYNGIAFASPLGAEVTVNRVLAAGLDMRQGETPFAPLLDRMIANPNMPEDEAAKLALEFLPSFYGNFRLGAASVEGVAVKVAQTQAEGQPASGPTDVTLDRLAFKAISGEGIEEIDFGGFAVASPQFGMRIGTIRLAGLAFPAIAPFLELVQITEAQKLAPDAPPDPATQARIADIALSMLPKLRVFEARDISGGIPGQEGVRLDSYVAETTAFLKSYPIAGVAEMVNLVIPGNLLRATPQAAAIFDGLGYGELVIGMNANGAYEEGPGRSVTDMTIDVKDAGAVSLGYTIGGLTEAWLTDYIKASVAAGTSDDPMAALAAWGGLTLGAAELRVADASLVDRAIRFVAPQQNVAPDVYREQLKGAVPFMMSSMPVGPELQLAASKAVQDFLDGGKTLVVTVRPKAPVPFSALIEAGTTAPQTIPELIGLSVGVE